MAVVLKEWSLDQQHQQHLGTSRMSKLPGPTQAAYIRNSGWGGPSMGCFKEPPGDSDTH